VNDLVSPQPLKPGHESQRLGWEKGRTRLNVEVTLELKDALIDRALADGVSLRSVVVDALEAWVAR
jgi:hypothetical protein